MPVEFMQYPPQENTGVSSDTLYKMAMAYDGTGRRISKTRWVKAWGDAGWSRKHVTHYTGIGTEVRENFAGESPETKVVVNMPQGLGRYGIEDADHVTENGSAQTFEWYLKNHLGSTMLVYGTGAGTPGGLKAAYDYRSFGEQVTLTSPSTGKVTENFTGKERDDETQLDYFGARYLDPMLGMWTSVDPKRQFASPYLYAGNGMNPVNIIDPDGNAATVYKDGNEVNVYIPVIFSGEAATPENIAYIKKEVASFFTGKYGKYDVTVSIFELPEGANGGDPSGINKVTLWNGPAPKSKCQRGSCAHIGREGSADIDMTGELRRFHVLHEIAHLLGLEDKYDYNTKKPYPTYEENLMGKAGKFGLKPEQIEEMWVPNSRKGSEGNNVYGPEK